ncbi:leucine-rich repeat protein kinase family protein [Artemisia annua]|uniref:Leucine-rich repeat protein kinase family protein n=1 Tax=Artemisia annua TaxID=35608 RepID=A0A2U1NKK4_ARTAN|nr:leucine-rich repeat protein kinase family protein [Artemisia annua]
MTRLQQLTYTKRHKNSARNDVCLQPLKYTKTTNEMSYSQQLTYIKHQKFSKLSQTNLLCFGTRVNPAGLTGSGDKKGKKNRINRLDSPMECYLLAMPTAELLAAVTYLTEPQVKLADQRIKDFLKWPNRMGMIMGIARGIQFLHTGTEHGIFENDLNVAKIGSQSPLNAHDASSQVSHRCDGFDPLPTEWVNLDCSLLLSVKCPERIGSRFLRNEAIGTDLGATNSHAAITEGKAVKKIITHKEVLNGYRFHRSTNCSRRNNNFAKSTYSNCRKESRKRIMKWKGKKIYPAANFSIQKYKYLKTVL